MDHLRQELQRYCRACEELLSDDLEPQLTQEEQELIIYYVNELSKKFDHKNKGG
jgi:hypothetical protein